MQFKRVEWNKLVVGDVVSNGGGLHELVRIDPGPEGTALIFDTGHTEIQYDLRDRAGELMHYLRALRSDEGGKPIPVMQLGDNPHVVGASKKQIIADYKRRREEVRKYGPTGNVPDWMRD